MHYDKIFNYIGSYNRYLWTSQLIVCLTIVTEAIHGMIVIFIFAETDHWCNLQGVCDHDELNSEECDIQAFRPPDDPDTLLIDESKCFQYDYTNFTIGSNLNSLEGTEHHCENGWAYDNSMYKTTATQEFWLVCSSARKVFLGLSIMYVGFTVSSPFVGNLSDRYGRKRTIVICLACLIVCDFASSLSPSYWVFVALRCCASMFSAGLYIPGIIYASEIVGPTERTLSTSIASSSWALGYAITGFYAYFIRTWRTLLMVICAVDVLILMLAAFLAPESPRWLHSVSRFKEAEEIIRKAVQGKSNIPDETFKDLKEYQVDVIITANTRASFKYLFRKKLIFARLVITMILGCTICMVIFGISLGVVDLTSNDYLAVAISGLSELPAVFASRFAMDRWGRRPVFGFLLTIGAGLCIGTVLTSGWLMLVLGTIGKFSLAAGYNVCIIFAAELFPTPIRNVGIGMVTMSSELGVVLAPQVMYIGVVWKHLPYLVFGAMCSLCVVLLVFLPETKGTNLPQTIQDGLNLGVSITLQDMKKMDSDSDYQEVPSDVLEIHE